jgi:hypothetical protein
MLKTSRDSSSTFPEATKQHALLRITPFFLSQMENQVIAHEYIKLNKLNALLQSLFGTNFSVDVSIRLMIDLRFEA